MQHLVSNMILVHIKIMRILLLITDLIRVHLTMEMVLSFMFIHQLMEKSGL